MKLLNTLLPLLLALVFGLLWWNPGTRHFAWVISDENKPIELLTFFSLFVGGLLGLALAWRLRGSGEAWFTWGFFLLFSLGLLLIAMEEISWGQWFFHFQTPEAIAWRNKQGELNLHNIGPMQGKGSVLRLLFTAGGLVGLGLARLSWMRRIAPPKALLPWLIVIGTLTCLEALIDTGSVSWSHDPRVLFQDVMPEMTEMLIGFAAFLYIWLNRRVHRELD